MMRIGIGLRLRRSAVQKIVFLLFFLAIVGAFGIVLFHFAFLFRSERGQTANEMNQFQTGAGGAMFRAGATKGRHASEANTIFDYPENVAVGKFLRFRGPQIRRLGIKSSPDLSVAATVVAVADGTVVSEVETRLVLNFWRIGDRIFRNVGCRRCGHFRAVRAMAVSSVLGVARALSPSCKMLTAAAAS